MKLKLVLISFLLQFFPFGELYSEDLSFNKTIVSLSGSNELDKLTIYRPIYFIFGKDDLKIQFSFKYRLLRSLPLYFGFTQKMFWHIYTSSQPIYDINYSPEVFYRFLDKEKFEFRTLDIGLMHFSNGKDETLSRSLNKAFLRASYLALILNQKLDISLSLFKILNSQKENPDIETYLGSWESTMTFLELISSESQSIDLELHFFAGSHYVNFNKGAYQVGIIYNFYRSNINPAVYLQYYEGFAENLLDYGQKRKQARLGFLLSY